MLEVCTECLALGKRRLTSTVAATEAATGLSNGSYALETNSFHPYSGLDRPSSHFARILSPLAARLDTQVLIATHSPYFVLPEQFAADATALVRRSAPLTVRELSDWV